MIGTARRAGWSAAAYLVAGMAAPLAAATPTDLLPPAAMVENAPALAPAPAPRWSAGDVHQLLRAIQSADAEGLSARDYHPDALRAALDADASSLDMVAEAAALALAHDFLFGRVADRQAMGWLIERSPYEASGLPAALHQALADGALDRFYAGLLPQDARYRAMRVALADAPDPATRDRLRANLERARWMPRQDVKDLLYVNVPSYRLQVVSGGTTSATYTVVVGARDTPTPALISPTSSFVVNPWWNVPQSIVRKSNLRPGRAGFQFTRGDGANWTVRQPPGPRNALGRLKFNLVNDQAIYLHDTPAKAGFGRDERALSHGCIRVKDIARLAAELMEGADGATVDPAALDTALAGNATETLRLPRTWPVYIVYFTEDVGEDGRLVSLPDTYGYDSRVVAALDGPPLQMASRD